MASNLIRITSSASQSIHRVIERNQAETARLEETHVQQVAVRERQRVEETARTKEQLGYIPHHAEMVADSRAKAADARVLREIQRAAADTTEATILRECNGRQQQHQATDGKAVADMHWCVDNLELIRADVGADFWEAGYTKNKPWAKDAFVPKRLALGTNKLFCAPFYHVGADPPGDKDTSYVRVSAELFGRVMHPLHREYISKDDNRKISVELSGHLTEINKLQVLFFSLFCSHVFFLQSSYLQKEKETLMKIYTSYEID
jgi:hypothetical protein